MNKRDRPWARGRRPLETTKRVIWVCLLNGFAWVWCSYALAYMDKTQIAESLSQVAVTEIVGLCIRKGPGTGYDAAGCAAPGVYTIAEEADGAGASKWGRLKSGAGWVSLDFCQRI